MSSVVFHVNVLYDIASKEIIRTKTIKQVVYHLNIMFKVFFKIPLFMCLTGTCNVYL